MHRFSVPSGAEIRTAEELAVHLREAIELGRIGSGERLPPIRELARTLRLSRHLVERAYRELAERGVVAATVGRGTVVLGQRPANGASDGSARVPFSAAAEAALAHLRGSPDAPELPAGVELIADFAHLWPDSTRFPVETFGACLQRVLTRDRGAVLRYGDPNGHEELRNALARDPELGAAASPEQILITSGAQQGIDLVLRAFAEPGSTVAVAVPTYHNLFALLKVHGLGLLPLAPDGADLEAALARPDVRLLYVMPTFHNPTGVTLDLAHREALMRVVARSRVPVLEDEFEQELRFTGKPLPSLQSLDPRGLTVTVRTFSKGLFPGVRIGWLSAAPEVLARCAALKRTLDLESSTLLQAALAEFIGEGAFTRHLRGLRAELRARHAAAQKLLSRLLPPGSRWTEPQGGYALWVELPPALDGESIAAAAAARGVLVTPGARFDPRGQPSSTLRLSLSRSDLSAIEAGLELLGAVARAQLGEPIPAARRALFL